MDAWLYIGIGMILLFLAGALFWLIRDSRIELRKEKVIQEKLKQLRENRDQMKITE